MLDYGAGAVWVASRETDTLTRLDPDTGALEVISSHVVLPGDVEVMGEDVWVSTVSEGQVFHVDAQDNTFSAIDVGGGLLTGFDAVYVAGGMGKIIPIRVEGGP